MSELLKYTPILKDLLESTGIPRPNFDTIVWICLELLARNTNQRMSPVAKILSLIMYAGHSLKEVCHLYNKSPLQDPQLFIQTFSCLGRLNLTVSHTSLFRLLDRIGARTSKSLMISPAHQMTQNQMVTMMHKAQTLHSRAFLSSLLMKRFLRHRTSVILYPPILYPPIGGY